MVNGREFRMGNTLNLRSRLNNIVIEWQMMPGEGNV
ncbi:hypothetical protein Tph_c19330 [Thermacetogenium phaeum DSM 12270]|uniref:Uncharacterized protein n=1 Tax=Thermacetogenium phaeum (strain ATCC BAA-254 / DSM 26808 / PB) TaxID=1089553 RepID=K4LJ84_THEPS|nr:hypothetical protein Tph_c19330 [Thermacetogenium phaeum DSM 12270]